MTPAEQAVIDAAKKWRAAKNEFIVHARTMRYSDAAHQLSEAVRLLEEEERKQTT